MLKVALRGLLAHKGRMLTTFAAVALGVAFMGGVLVLTDTMNRSFDDLFADVFRDTDAVVRSSQTFDSDFGDVRGLIDADLLPEISSADGVRAALHEVLTDPRHRQGAERVAAASARAGGAVGVADDLENLGR